MASHTSLFMHSMDNERTGYFLWPTLYNTEQYSILNIIKYSFWNYAFIINYYNNVGDSSCLQVYYALVRQ